MCLFSLCLSILCFLSLSLSCYLYTFFCFLCLCLSYSKSFYLSCHYSFLFLWCFPFLLSLSLLCLFPATFMLSFPLFLSFWLLSFYLFPIQSLWICHYSFNLLWFFLSFLSFLLSLSLSLCCPLSAIAADNRKNMTIVFRELRPSEGKHLATLLIGCRLLILPHCFKREFKRRRIRRRRRSKSFPDADDASKGSKDRRWLE